MIVVYQWSTQKNKRFGFTFEGKTFSYLTKSWKGYFLFGIIPLLIINTHSVYSI